MPMAPATIVDRIFSEFQDLLEYLDSAPNRGEPFKIHFRSATVENFQKTILLASASYFEHRIVHILEEFFSTHSNFLIKEFALRKGLKRQFHTLFDWDGRNANKFFSLFGDQFKTYMTAELANDEALNEGVSAFISLGSYRNALVHQNFGMHSLDKTPEEIYDLHKKASIFVESLSMHLNACADGASP